MHLAAGSGAVRILDLLIAANCDISPLDSVRVLGCGLP